jgi:hypothetical protein
MDFSTNYPCPSITHGKITVEQKLKLSVLLAKESYQFGKHNGAVSGYVQSLFSAEINNYS